MPTPAFFYQDPLPLGSDDTEYRLLSRDGISTATFEGREILKVAPEALAYLAREAFHDTSFLLRTRHLQQVAAILDDPEASPNDRFVALDLLKNANIAAGFVLLTLTLGSGIVFSEELFGKAMRFNHKTVFGILSWLIFAALLGGRQLYGWRGRIAVRWTLAGFLMLVLAYVGSKFVLEVLLGRT